MHDSLGCSDAPIAPVGLGAVERARVNRLVEPGRLNDDAELLVAILVPAQEVVRRPVRVPRQRKGAVLEADDAVLDGTTRELDDDNVGVFAPDILTAEGL
jgi:hypothetical protein